MHRSRSNLNCLVGGSGGVEFMVSAAFVFGGCLLAWLFEPESSGV
jgi:hypothetical protein